MPDTAAELAEGWEGSDPPPEPPFGELAAPSVTLADVGGMDEVKRRLELSFLAPLRRPDLSLAFGTSSQGGLLLWGPPGCGKTFIARALAGELGASFYELGLADVLDMWVGSSERNLHAAFDFARRQAPCLLFLDEIDALGQRRTNLRGSGATLRNVVNQLLVELDGASSDNAGVFVLAATNHPWDVDPALLRPGRLDRQLLVLPPDAPARRVILEHHLRGRPVGRVDLDKVARLTEGRTGADLALICRAAAEVALRESMDEGSVRQVSQRDLLDGVRGLGDSIGGWFDTARNYAIYNNDEGQYDELLDHLARRR